MKKHAKKSLLLPFAVLCVALAVGVACYLNQAFSAYADAETSNSSNEANASQVTAKIHLSTGDIFRGAVIDNQYKGGDGTTEFIAWEGARYETFEDVVDFDIYTAKGPIENLSNDKFVDENTTCVVIRPDHGGATPENIIEDKYIEVYLPKMFYDYAGANVNFTLADNTVDITISVVPSFYICFNANGGSFDAMKNASTQWVAQGEYNYINLPYNPVWKDDTKVFAGWYTDPFWGERITGDTQVSSLTTNMVLYAHWADVDSPMSVTISTSDFGQMFHWELLSEESGKAEDDNSVGPIDYREGDAYSYTIDKAIAPYPGFDSISCRWGWENDAKAELEKFGDLAKEEKVKYKNAFIITWSSGGNYYKDGNAESSTGFYALLIAPMSGQRIEGASLNGGPISMLDRMGTPITASTLQFSQYNNIELSFGWAMPSIVNIASDNGSMFKCSVQDYDHLHQARLADDNSVENDEFVTDFLPIFVDSDEYVFYSYGSYADKRKEKIDKLSAQADGEESLDPTGVPFTILVTDFYGRSRVYSFSDNRFTDFDWFNLNSYILGVSVDGTDMPYSNYFYKLDAGFHDVNIKMSSHEADTTVTYDANGGVFADGQTTHTYDAVYGEALTVSDNPALAENDFVGWFTQAEGGVQVDPANYQWNPWERWNGVKLYAHWAYNPQPVPPEPGPTPEPVNPDVPGGGGAQTGDSMPLAPIAALAVIAALGCGLAIRKENF